MADEAVQRRCGWIAERETAFCFLCLNKIGVPLIFCFHTLFLLPSARHSFLIRVEYSSSTMVGFIYIFSCFELPFYFGERYGGGKRAHHGVHLRILFFKFYFSLLIFVGVQLVSGRCGKSFLSNLGYFPMLFFYYASGGVLVRLL